MVLADRSGGPPGPPLDEQGAAEIVAALCRQATIDADGEACRIGLESEGFAMRVDGSGSPTGRVPADEVEQLFACVEVDEPGTRLSVEPGGQPEIASPPGRTVAEAVKAVEESEVQLIESLAEHRAVLAHAGLDLWHDETSVPQQLTVGRYVAMADYFDRRPGSQGSVMMRHTASLQVNLDLGAPGVARERWLMANLAAPLLVGTFACSPTTQAASGRARIWQRTDPTRTGVPAALVRGVDDPAAVLAEFALGADVLLVVRPDGTVDAGTPGWRFADWLRAGHRRYGPPTGDDLVRHLSTLFPEVRLRGWLEVRCIDALPRRWRAVPAVLLAGLLYDDRARSEGLRVLERIRPRLDSLLHRAAVTGMADPALCALGPTCVDHDLLGGAELFLDRFTLRGRCPADELRERMVAAPDAALAWASEVTDVPAGVT